MNRNRQCCDGLCQQGRHCPLVPSTKCHPLRFAPGVIDGPHPSRRGPLRRWLGRIGSAIAQAFTESCV